MTASNNVLISIASNHEAQQHLAQGIAMLREHIHQMELTQELWTTPVNSLSSQQYLNQLVRGTTLHDEGTLNRLLKEIEYCCGRRPEDKTTGRVVLDLDILAFNGQRRHLNDWNREYVKRLLQEF